MILIASIFALTFISTAATAPVNDEYVTWQKEPNTRGTFSILSSCIVTLVLCVYTAVHMNVPHPSATPAENRWRLASWVFAGIFAPEFVVWTAWCQWSEARMLTKELKKMQIDLGERNESIPLDAVHGDKYQDEQNLLASWTFKHSFFVVMGGYQFRPSAVDRNSEHHDFLTSITSTMYVMMGRPIENRRLKNMSRSILTPSVVLELLRNGHANKFPALSHKDIADRSKADNIAKTLSCIQGLWLVFQLLGRVLDGLTITELEVNTFAHVVCAIAMYGFWMSKPLSVAQPVYVDHQGLESWILLHTGLGPGPYDELFSCKLGTEKLLSETDVPVTHEHGPYVLPRSCDKCNWNRRRYKDRRMVGFVLESDVAKDPAQLAWEIGQISGTGVFIDFVTRQRDWEASNYMERTRFDIENHIDVSEIYVDSKVLDVYLRIWNLPDRDELLERCAPKMVLSLRASMIPRTAYENSWRASSMIAISSCYGGLHATLWHYHFPTEAERWLWNTSALVVAGNGLLAVIAWIIYDLLDIERSVGAPRIFGGHHIRHFVRRMFHFLMDHTVESEIRAIEHISEIVLGSMIWGIVAGQVIFIFCRMFLFIEAFVSIRSQPPDVYLTPQWSQWLPHL